MLSCKRAITSILAGILVLNALTAHSFAGYSGLTEDEPILLPIIMYHEVKTGKVGKDVILPAEFELDLKYLAENNFTTITMDDLIKYVYDKAELPEKPIILSFDDGYLNNYVFVLPLLKKYNMKIVFSIIGKNTDDFTRIPDDNVDYSHVTWQQLNEMLASGYVEVQNHTYNLHSIKGRLGCMQRKYESESDYQRVLSEDIGKLQEQITLMTGKTPTTFVYPYGQYTSYTDSILKEMGFRATLTCDYGINTITRNPGSLYCMKRICRSHNHAVEKLINDVYKTLH